jgi:hypothetical protein
MSFKDEFLKTPPGPAREELVYRAAIQQGSPKNLVPVTVPGPNGTKITYQAMSDYVMIDGIRVPMAPTTAQRVANHFGMVLPTAKMSQQIYDAAKTKVRANPLSGTGYVSPLTGKKYSPQEVVKSRIGESDAAVYYSNLTDQELARFKNPGLISGHGKEITEPRQDASTHDVSFGGWQGSGGKPLQSYTYAHKGQAGGHTEYALNTRLIDDKVTVTLPDGKIISTTMQKLRANPNFSNAVADATGIKTYDTKNVDKSKKSTTPDKTKTIEPVPTKTPAQIANFSQPKTDSNRTALLQKIDDLLSQFTKG